MLTSAKHNASPLPMLEDLDDPDFNPFTADALAWGDTLDPYQRIRELAAQGWLYPGEYRRLFVEGTSATTEGRDFRYFTIFGYDKCHAALTNPEVFSNWAHTLGLGISFGKSISTLDPPEHTRYRRIFQKAFLPHTVRQWSDSLVEPVIGELLDKVMDRGGCDLVQDFALHFPFQIIFRQLDLPLEDIKLFHKLAVAQTAYHVAPAIAAEAGRKLGVYFSAMVQQRRNQPGDDLVSTLATAEVDGERLPEDVVVSFLRQLTNAGGDTTYRATSCLLTGLLQHPEQLDAVRQDRSLVAAAIDEALRMEPPVSAIPRWTRSEITMDGLTIPKDAHVEICLWSANRDPEKFANPDQFDIFRDSAHRHLAFNTGPHVCIGQHLARVEMDRALNAVLDRLPGLKLDPDMPPPEIRGFNLRTPRHLHVRFDSERRRP